MIVLCFETAKRLAEEVVNEWGQDFVYNPGGRGWCAYVPAADPRFPFDRGSRFSGCIIGEILKRVGLLTDAVARSTGSVTALRSRGLLKMTDDAYVFLSKLQFHQDGGMSWGEALATATGELR